MNLDKLSWEKNLKHHQFLAETCRKINFSKWFQKKSILPIYHRRKSGILAKNCRKEMVKQSQKEITNAVVQFH